MAMKLIDKLLERIKENSKLKERLKLQGKTSFLESVNHALDGISYTASHERNFKIELFMMVVVLIAGVYFRVSRAEWLILLLTISMVLALELINTAIERCVDLVTKDYHELAKCAKDIAAGAVFIMSIFAVCVGIIIFLPKIIEMIGVN